MEHWDYFIEMVKHIFGAETNPIGGEKEKFCAETNECIWKTKIVFTFGAENKQNTKLEP